MDSAKVLVQKLNNTNYSIWKYKVKLLLIKEDLWNIVASEEQSRNEDTISIDEWKRKDCMAMATICLLVDDNQLIHIRNAESAKESWDCLKLYHEKATLSNKVHLMRKICSLKLSNEGNLEEHLNEMMNLFEKLSALGEKILTDKWIIAILLSSLSNRYDTLISIIETKSEDELTLEFVKGKLLEDYERRCKKEESLTEKALKTNVSFQKKQEVRECYFCKKQGHLKKDCKKYKTWKLNKEKQKINHISMSKFEDRNVLFGISKEKQSTDDWYIDSGATCHICVNKDNFTKLDFSIHEVVYVANGQSVVAQGKGTCHLNILNCDNNETSVTVENVLYVPNLESNLLSVRKLTEKGFDVIFKTDTCLIQRNIQAIAKAYLYLNLYKLVQPNKVLNTIQKRTQSLSVDEWHRIFGHRDIKAIKHIYENNLATGMKIYSGSNEVENKLCEVCIEGKLSRKPFPKRSATNTKYKLDLIHTDVCGPMQNISPSGKKYVLTFIDDYSRYTVVYLLKYKSEVYEKLKEYVQNVKTKFSKTPKVIRSDRGGEYMSKEMIEFLKREGIQHQYTAPYSPQQNGVAERKNRYLVEMVRCMLIDSNFEKKYWAETIMTANYLQNLLPNKQCCSTPYEIWFDEKPDFYHLKIFGSKVFVHIPEQQRRKLDSKAKELYFIGYDQHSKAYRLLDKENDKIIISRDVIFIKDDEKLKITQKIQSEVENNHLKENVLELQITKSTKLRTEENKNDKIIGKDYDNNTNTDNQEIRTSSRINKGVPPKRYDEKINNITNEFKKPQSYKEALSLPEKEKWITAMKEEIKCLNEKETWNLTSLPENRKAVGCKWIFKIKRGLNGEIIKYKARLVAQGYSQKYGSDYDEVFAPVIRQTTLRTFLSVAGKRKMKVFHYDVKTAFLNGNLNEDIYMKQPSGFQEENAEHLVCKLNKSIYGLKQAARSWNQAIDQILKDQCFMKSKNDPCLYMKNISGHWCYLLIYVDDILIAADSKEEIQKIGDNIGRIYEIKNLGEVKHYIGLEIERDNEGNFSISQKSYIQKVIEMFQLENAKISTIPIDSGYDTANIGGEIMIDNYKYQKLIGCLLYISVNTRPDISESVSILSRKITKPTNVDWLEAKRILRYLKGTIDMKLTINEKENQNSTFHGYADADWAQNKIDRKSNSGFLFKLNGGTISWSCRKQTCVSLSSTEAEFIALSEAVQEAEWLRRLLIDFNAELELPIIIYEDNQSCLKLIEGEKFSNRSKHIDTKFHFVKNLQQEGKFVYKYCPTQFMIADLLTKPLAATRIQQLRKLCGLQYH